MVMDQEDPHSASPVEWGHSESSFFDENIISYDNVEDDTWIGTSYCSQISYCHSPFGDTVTKHNVVPSIERGLANPGPRQPDIANGSASEAMRIGQTNGQSAPLDRVGDFDARRATTGGHVDINSPSSGSRSGGSQEQSSHSIDTSQARRRHDRITGHYKCSFHDCNAVWDRQSELNKHIRAVHGDKPFICLECHKGFAYNKDLKRHIPTHIKPATGSDLSDDVSSSCRGVSPVSYCSPNRKRVDSPGWVHTQSVESKRSRKSVFDGRHDSPMEVAAATLNAEVSVRAERHLRTRNVPARSNSAMNPEGTQSSTRQHIDDLRKQFDQQLLTHIPSSNQLQLPLKLEFGAVCNDTIIVASRELLTTFSSRYNADSQLKLRMPAGPPDQRRKLLNDLKRSVANCATRSMTNIVFVGIDPQSYSISVVEVARSSKMLSRLVESCSAADTEELALRAWDTLNDFLQSILDEHQSDFAENCHVCWTRSAAE